MSLLASYWAAKGWDAILVTLASREEDFFTLHPRVRRIGLGLEYDSTGPIDALGNNGKRVRALRRLIKSEHPDAVLSFQDRMNVVTLLAACGTGVPVVVSERVDPRHHEIGRIWAWMRRQTYPWASRIVAQTESVAVWLGDIVTPERIAVLPNPVESPQGDDAEDLRRLAGVPAGAHIVLGVGRLVRQKGFDLLVTGFAAIARDRADWHLVIFGDGPERHSLTTLAATYGIKGRVHLPGCVREPGRLLPQADLFVLSSRFEGFPNALLEAMAAGVPVIATDCPSGPRDIVQSGSNGLLVESENAMALARAMRSLMDDASEALRLGDQARAVTKRFSVDRILRLWELNIEKAIRS